MSMKLRVRAAWLASLALGAAFANAAELQWYRGNTHTHTLNSDGNASPETVVRWYREHGYQFVFITDHEFVTDVAPLNTVHGAQGRFLVMPGQEVSQLVRDPRPKKKFGVAHVNALGTSRVVTPLGDPHDHHMARDVSMAETFVRNVAAIMAAGGIPQINHPNGHWSVIPADLTPLEGPFLLEVWNAAANNLGGTDEEGETALSAEDLWDALLSEGKAVWGVGSDDSHDYTHLDDVQSHRPGLAWITVRAPQLTPEAIMSAIRRGEFYASTGIVLADYSADRKSIAITIERWKKPGVTDDRRLATRFVGKHGRVLAEVAGLKPRYTIRGDEGYVRASIVDSRGSRAWTQPVFLSPSP